MANLILNGSTSGSVTLSSPAVSGTTTLTLPTTSGTVLTSGTNTNFPAGSILQVVQTVKTDTFSTAVQSYTDVTGLSASITPSKTSSKILVLLNVYCSISAAAVAGYVTVLRGSTNLITSNGSRTPTTISLEGSTGAGMQYTGVQASMSYLDSPSTTSSTTYKVQAMTNTGAGLIYINRNANDSNTYQYATSQSTLTLLEVAA